MFVALGTNPSGIERVLAKGLFLFYYAPVDLGPVVYVRNIPLLSLGEAGANFLPRKIPGRILNKSGWRPSKAKTFAFDPSGSTPKTLALWREFFGCLEPCLSH